MVTSNPIVLSDQLYFLIKYDNHVTHETIKGNNIHIFMLSFILSARDPGS